MCFIIFNIQMIPALTALRTLLRSAAIALMILRGETTVDYSLNSNNISNFEFKI